MEINRATGSEAIHASIKRNGKFTGAATSSGSAADEMAGDGTDRSADAPEDAMPEFSALDGGPEHRQVVVSAAVVGERLRQNPSRSWLYANLRLSASGADPPLCHMKLVFAPAPCLSQIRVTALVQEPASVGTATACLNPTTVL